MVLVDNVFGTPEEDALRRDFTINALAYNIADFSVIDYSTGLGDLKQRLIRPIGDPRVRFTEDPVRMLRAVRFAASHDFVIEPVAWESLCELPLQSPAFHRQGSMRRYRNSSSLGPPALPSGSWRRAGFLPPFSRASVDGSMETAAAWPYWRQILSASMSSIKAERPHRLRFSLQHSLAPVWRKRRSHATWKAFPASRHWMKHAPFDGRDLEDCVRPGTGRQSPARHPRPPAFLQRMPPRRPASTVRQA